MVLEVNFSNFYEKNYKKHLTRINSILYNMESSEDIVQEAYAEAFSRMNEFDPKRASFPTWFNYILFSVLRKKQREYKNEPETLCFEDMKNLSEDSQIGQIHIHKLVEESGLSETHKNVLIFYYCLGFTVRETALITGLSETNVTTICSRFKKDVV